MKEKEKKRDISLIWKIKEVKEKEKFVYRDDNHIDNKISIENKVIKVYPKEDTVDNLDKDSI